MNDPSIAVAMLGAGSRPARSAATSGREPWLVAVRRWCVARLAGAHRAADRTCDGPSNGPSDGRA